MTRTLVWDLPTRLFHWLLAGSFLSAFTIATVIGDDGALFPLHAGLGLVAVFMVALRLVWGVVGSRWSRLSSFAWSPAELVRYLRDALPGREGRRWAGHNPGSTWAAAVMFLCVLGLGVTGVAMSRGSEAAEEIHEVLAWGMLAAVAVHLAGIAWHTIRHREVIALGMVDGRKIAEPSAAIPSARPVVALVFLALTGAWAGGLAGSYDAATQEVTLPLMGQVTLGEGEEHHDEHGSAD